MRLPSVSRRRALAYGVVALVLLVLGGRVLLQGDTEPETQAESPSEPAILVEAAAPSDAAAAGIVVHVVGAVQRPGIYELAQRARVSDALREAGGATSDAALEHVNLAAPLADGQQVRVPARAEGPAASGSAGTAAPAPSGPSERVYLNSATVEQLQTLPGVGPVTAGRIVEHRETHGPFRSIEELDAVPGIGPARVEQLRELVAV